jgi:phospholipid/cholesterol/gamma-HCH transport system substrate-binding protein
VSHAIRKHFRDFIAVTLLILVSLATAYFILQQQRLRIPILEEKPFELKADFQTAQAVVPGQGQTIRVAGVRIGDVSDVQLVDGHAEVTFQIDRKFLPIYKDANILMRPTTGLKDMFFELDPGTVSAGEYDEGDTIPLANTAPDVNLDEILSALDGDTQAYLKILIVGAGKGVDGRAKDLGQVLGTLGPINRELSRLNSKVAERRHNLSHLVHNLGVLTKAVGTQDSQLSRLIGTSNTTLGAIAEQDPDVQRTVSLLPGALKSTTTALNELRGLGDELGPTFHDLRPFARNLPRLNSSTKSLADRVTPVIKNQVRPFVRAARPVIPPLKTAARRYTKAAPRLTVVGKKLNRLGNMAAYNPRGAEDPGVSGRDEGYLYWAAWLAHNGNSAEGGQDANGGYRRIYFTARCDQLVNLLQGSPGGPVIAGIVTGLAPVFAPGGACSP